MSVEYRVGDVRDRLAEIPDGSIDLIVTSPPFLALRSYLPADHPDKAREIGSEPTPAEFIDTLLALSAEWGRVLAPHGSLCVELGDTFSGNNESGFHRGSEAHTTTPGRTRAGTANGHARNLSSGWPLAKSLTGIPTLYPWSLAYGRNLLTGEASPAGQWRIRNVIVWARPNPPVGALGDKFRPATSYITVACRGAKRYFDLDAVRTEYKPGQAGAATTFANRRHNVGPGGSLTGRRGEDGVSGTNYLDGAGAPPLDWHADDHPEDGDWLWKLSTQPYKGSHFATFPMALPKRLIEAMCPLRVCVVCGRPSERIVEVENLIDGKPIDEFVADHVAQRRSGWEYFADNPHAKGLQAKLHINNNRLSQARESTWSDCGCQCVEHEDYSRWLTGIVLDPFAGSCTTLEAAQAVGRHAIGIDLDQRNADLARERCGMFLEVAS